MIYSASAIIAVDRFHDPFFFLKKQLFWAVIGFGCPLDRAPRGLPAARAPGRPAARRVLRPARAGARAAVRPGDQRDATLVPRRPVLLPAGGAGEVLARALPGGLSRSAAGADVELHAGTRAAAAGGRAHGRAHDPSAGPRQQRGARHPHADAGAIWPARARSTCSRSAAPRCRWSGCSSRSEPYRWRRMLAFVESLGRSAGHRLSDHPVLPGARVGRLVRASGSASPSRSCSTCRRPTPISSSRSSARSWGSSARCSWSACSPCSIWRGLRVGLRAPDAFGGYLALGLTVMLATQTLVNLGVVTGALAHQGAAVALRVVRRLGAAHDDVLHGRAAEHLAVRVRPRGKVSRRGRRLPGAHSGSH